MIKKLVFVSVPMAGKETPLVNRHIQITRDKYVKATNVNVKEVAFIDNFDKGTIDSNFENMKHTPVAYLGRAIKRIALCDAAVFGDGWENSRGCRIEHKVCEEYGIDIIE